MPDRREDFDWEELTISLLKMSLSLVSMILPIAIFLAMLYGLVRFVKWAWEG